MKKGLKEMVSSNVDIDLPLVNNKAPNPNLSTKNEKVQKKC